jgi:hypothetical protein
MAYDIISEKAESYAQNLVYKKDWGHREAYLATDKVFGYAIGSTAHHFSLKSAEARRKKAAITAYDKQMELEKKLDPVYKYVQTLIGQGSQLKDAIKFAASKAVNVSRSELKKYVLKKEEEKRKDLELSKKLQPHIFGIKPEKKGQTNLF